MRYTTRLEDYFNSEQEVEFLEKNKSKLWMKSLLWILPVLLFTTIVAFLGTGNQLSDKSIILLIILNGTWSAFMLSNIPVYKDFSIMDMYGYVDTLKDRMEVSKSWMTVDEIKKIRRDDILDELLEKSK